MSSYSIFAKYYDILTQNVNYKVRSEYISGFFKGRNIKTILDLACGTGSMSVEFGKKGYKIIGVDASEDMLSIAENKLREAGCDYSLILSKMQEFTLPEPVDACICCLDSINHITSAEDVKKTFENVYNSLSENGIFIFDFNTLYKHKFILANQTFVYDYEDFFLSWDNELAEDDMIRIILDFFVFNGKNYDRYSEEFYERAYHHERFTVFLEEIGFKKICFYDDLQNVIPKTKSERVYMICEK